MPPATESTTLSVSNCASSRARLTPSASRTAISRRRAIPRASCRFATFAQAMSITTSDTAPSSVATRALVSWARASLGSTEMNPMLGRCAAIFSSETPSLRMFARNVRVAAADAAARVTPGATRITVSSQKPLRLCTHPSYCAAVTPAVNGIQTSTRSSSTPVNPAGATPMIENRASPIGSSRPSTCGSPLNSCCQYEVRDDGEVRRGWRAVVFGGEESAEPRPNTERAEVTRRDLHGGHAARIDAATDRQILRRIRRDIGECAGSAAQVEIHGVARTSPASSSRRGRCADTGPP